MNVADVLRIAAVRRADKEMLCFGERRWTFAQANQRVNAIARVLRATGVRPGTAVASVARNSGELLFLYFALAKLGALNVPLNTMLTAREITAALSRSSTHTLILGEGFLDLEGALETEDLRFTRRLETLGDELGGAQAAELSSGIGGDDPATVIFTSGSTGTPKGCVKSHANQVWAAVNCQLTVPRRPGDVELFAIPLSGIGFANFALAAVLGGARLVLSTFEPSQCLDLIAREGVTHAFLAGTMIAAMLEAEGQEAYDTSNLRVLQTSYHLSDPLRRRIADRFGPVVRYCGGSSEGSMSTADANLFLVEPKCVGYPVGLDEYRVIDEEGRDAPVGVIGEIIVSGPTVMLGYFGDEAATRAAFTPHGWLRSGDLGRLDEQGRLHFEGRKRDMIKTGGLSVTAGEVEMVLAQHPGVAEVAVLGIPDERWGEAIRAIIVPSGSEIGDDALEKALRDHCRAELAGFKRPKDYLLVDELPKNPGGKIAKGILRKRFGAPIASSVAAALDTPVDDP